MTDIPVIDFKNLPFNDNLNSEELNKWKEIGEEVYKACSEYGFFYIKNHGIAKEDIENQFKISKEFFDFPSSEKNQYQIQPGDSYGYFALKQETLEPEAGPDHKEAFNVLTATTEVSPQRIPPYFKQNQDNLKDFYSKCHQLSMKILRSFALGLKLEDYKFFDDSNKQDLRSGTTLRYLHYPPIQNATEELANKKIIRCGAHSDYGTVTLLFQSECEGLDSDFSGLQVRHGKNNWLNVGNKEGCIVVNTGDLMSIWTEGRFKSPIHRVLVPNTEIAKIHRYTLVFFSHSNSDFPIYSLKTPIPAPSPVKCVTNPNTGQVEYHSTLGASPFIFGETDGIYLRRRLTATIDY